MKMKTEHLPLTADLSRAADADCDAEYCVGIFLQC